MAVGLSIGLFICLCVAFFLLCVPISYEETSPANLAVDTIKRRIMANYTAGNGAEIMEILGKDMKDVLKTGLVTGIGLATLIFLITFRFIGPYSAIFCILAFILGVSLTEKVLQNEYKKWQDKLLEGVPPLINFVPAFLEVEGVTPREALGNTVPFLPEPLKTEMWSAMNRIKRTSRVREAMDVLSQKAKHPLIDAICFRLSAAWDTKITSDIFVDFADQVESINEIAATRATAAKTGYLALICVIGLIGMLLIYGYPGFKFLMEKMTGVFG